MMMLPLARPLFSLFLLALPFYGCEEGGSQWRALCPPRQLLERLVYEAVKSPSFLEESWCFPGGSAVKNPSATQKMWVWSLDQKEPLEEETATHPSILAWESHGQRSLMDYSPGGCKRWTRQRLNQRHRRGSWIRPGPSTWMRVLLCFSVSFSFIYSIRPSVYPTPTHPLFRHIPPAREPAVSLPSQPFSNHLSNQAKRPPQPFLPTYLPFSSFLPCFKQCLK